VLVKVLPGSAVQQRQTRQISVDFFMLAGSTTRIIYHIDVYQGRNDSNVGILEEYHDTPTTMKAVLNAVALSGYKRYQRLPGSLIR